jgi:hypothetical protein
MGTLDTLVQSRLAAKRQALAQGFRLAAHIIGRISGCFTGCLPGLHVHFLDFPVFPHCLDIGARLR